MYGGFTGWGTTEQVVWSVLEGKSLEQIDRIRTVYQDRYGRDLDGDLQRELNDRTDELQRLQDLLRSDPIGADAAALHYALKSPVDKEEVYRLLERRSPAQVDAIWARYQERYENEPLTAAIQEHFDGAERKRAMALLLGDRAQADAAALFYAMDGLTTNEAMVYGILSGNSASENQATAEAYEFLYSESLLDAIHGDFSGAERDRALALFHGDPITAAAARIRSAMDWPGTDEEDIWATLENLTSEKRAMIAQVYRRMYGAELWSDIQEEFSNTDVWGEELSRTRDLLYNGGLSDAERLFYATDGWGTHETTVRQVMASVGFMDQQQLNDFKAAYRSRSGGVEVESALQAELSEGSRDLFVSQQQLLGRPQNFEEELQRLRALRDFERDTAWFMDVFGTDGVRLNTSLWAAESYFQQARDNNTLHLPAVQQRLRELIAHARDDVISYQDAKDSAADTVGTVVGTALATVVGFGVVWISGGTAAPLYLKLVAMVAAGTAGAGGEILGHVTVAGQSYDVADIPVHGVEGFINGATAISVLGSLPNAGTRFGVVLQRVRTILAGGTGAAIGGIVGTAMQEGVWENGVWEGVTHLGQAGLLNFGVGAVTVGVLDGLFGQFSRLREPVSNELEAVQQRIARALRIRILSWDPQAQQWRPDEGLAGIRLEDYLGIRFEPRVKDQPGDFFHRASRRAYDACSPPSNPAAYANYSFEKYKRALREHFQKSDVHTIVVDLVGRPPDVAAQVRAYLETLPEFTQPGRLIIFVDP